MPVFQMHPVILTSVPGKEPGKCGSGPSCLFIPEQEEAPRGIQFCCLLMILWRLKGSPQVI